MIPSLPLLPMLPLLPFLPLLPPRTSGASPVIYQKVSLTFSWWRSRSFLPAFGQSQMDEAGHQVQHYDEAQLKFSGNIDLGHSSNQCGCFLQQVQTPIQRHHSFSDVFGHYQWFIMSCTGSQRRDLKIWPTSSNIFPNKTISNTKDTEQMSGVLSHQSKSRRWKEDFAHRKSQPWRTDTFISFPFLGATTQFPGSPW